MHSPFVHPDKVLARGSVILSSLLVATMLSSYATVDAAVRSGEVTEYVINPSIQAYNSFIADLEKQMAEDRARTPKNSIVRYRYSDEDSATDSATVHIETNVTTTTTSDDSGGTTKTRNVIIVTPRPAATPYQSQLNDNWEQEALERQAQSRAEFEARSKQMDAEYEARTQQNQEEARKRFEEEVAKMRADNEAKKAEMGF